MENMLALDLATKTGWARRFGGVIESGTEILASAKELRADKERGLDRNGDKRFYRLIGFLQKQIHECQNQTGQPIHRVLYEDVQFSTFTLQTQLWSALRTALWAQFPPCGPSTIVGLPVGSLKLFATGHGNATKEMMAAWLLKKNPKLFHKPQVVTAKRILVSTLGADVDDNEVDAYHLLAWGMQTFRS